MAKAIKEDYVCEYTINCEVCGVRSGKFLVDNGNKSECLKALVRQFNEVTLPNHLEHGFTFENISYYPELEESNA